MIIQGGIEDIELIRKTLDGDRDITAMLYEKYKNYVTNYIKTNYSTIKDIDDDVSEIMIKIFTNLSSYDINKSKFSSWVLVITKNYLIDKWRCTPNKCNENSNITKYLDVDYSSIHENLSNINLISYPSSNSFSIDTLISDSTANNCFEYSDSISYIGNNISPVDYTMLTMKYFQGYDYCEIGKEFNVTSSTVSNRVNYIKTILKKNYSDLYLV